MSLEQIVGELQGIANSLKKDIDRLDKRINGTFDDIATHIKDGEYYRNRIIAHDVKMKLLTWIFSILTIPVVVLCVRIFLME